MYDRYLAGSLVVCALMGCYLSKWRWCLTLALSGGGASRAEVEYDEEERVETPRKEPMKRNVEFRTPLVKEILVPALCDVPKWVRDDMYWGSEDYAAIRDNQRRLIELVMRQVREYPEGVVPPPIPGESRRGLGLICEPGTNSGRAARVRSARRAVVEAYRDGYSPEMISKLASELSQWATKNAYDVGIKDHEAAADFDLGSFATLERHRSSRSESVDAMPPNAKVARAARHSQDEDDEEDMDLLLEEDEETDSALLQKQPYEDNDGLGLASMIRNDSLNNLQQALHAESSPAPAKTPPHDTPPDESTTMGRDDGMGLASMIRNDSLGNLHALDAAAHQQQSPSSSPSSGAGRDPLVEAYG